MAQFKHDCDCCIPLGSTVTDEGPFDLYVCNQVIGGTTLIARWGNKPEENLSGFPFDSTSPMVPAMRRALDLLLKQLFMGRLKIERTGKYVEPT